MNNLTDFFLSVFFFLVLVVFLIVIFTNFDKILAFVEYGRR